MSEAAMRQTIILHFRRLGAHVQRIEDSASVGVPDLNVCVKGGEGWVEFKHVDEQKVPKRAATPMKIGLKPEQAIWLNQRTSVGGNAYVLTKIEPNHWYLHTGPGFHDRLTVPWSLLRDGWALEYFQAGARLYWKGNFQDHAAQVLDIVTGRATF